MKTTPRLHIEDQLAAGLAITLSREQAHYLTSVLRLAAGDPVRAFNGRDGEWLCYLADVTRKGASLQCERQSAAAVPPPDIDYCFAPLKHARLDYVVQKATELGVRRLRPVITQRTIVERVNLDRMRANVSEAAEQCNLVFVPEVAEPEKLAELVARRDANRALVYCDETMTPASPLSALADLKLPVAVLVGPEGGFTDAERDLLRSTPGARPLSLGPRVMRADTAAVAALTLLQAALGDWH
ncbi:16S rRNA (uracil(1498)-N(3))-methyltransferase [Aestuariivirga sp.]|jgi:16S rRNA (uracil1498-N3)-methyltransferase|uniref:16S rRNA (uracil(1498)-N(3))-methyltransferase n=1 Tax=Aestuariivirga sp. TaxID=2650926 RepID=UPI0037835F0D